MQNSVEDKVVLITGGGSGIGKATALLFAKAGAKLALADINAQAGQETAEFITSHGSEAIFIQADVSQADQVLNMVEETVARYGRLDCAFNNAGIEGETKRTMDVTEDDFDRIIAINLKGVWLCMKYELEQMVRQEAWQHRQYRFRSRFGWGAQFACLCCQQTRRRWADTLSRSRICP